jgi:hypothetical protein
MFSIPVSPGELLDRWTILHVKAERLRSSDQLVAIEKEVDSIRETSEALLLEEGVGVLVSRLYEANAAMWDAMESVYQWEGDREGKLFNDLLISIIDQNKERAIQKRKLDLLLKSGFVEAKSFFVSGDSSDTI